MELRRDEEERARRLVNCCSRIRTATAAAEGELESGDSLEEEDEENRSRLWRDCVKRSREGSMFSGLLEMDPPADAAAVKAGVKKAFGDGEDDKNRRRALVRISVRDPNDPTLTFAPSDSLDPRISVTDNLRIPKSEMKRLLERKLFPPSLWI